MPGARVPAPEDRAHRDKFTPPGAIFTPGTNLRRSGNEETADATQRVDSVQAVEQPDRGSRRIIRVAQESLRIPDRDHGQAARAGIPADYGVQRVGSGCTVSRHEYGARLL